MPKANNQRADRGANKKSGNAPKLNAEEQRKLLAKELGLKPKSIAVLNELIDNKQISKVDAYLKHHSTTNRATARAAVAKLTAKDSARIYTASAVGKAKRRVVELVGSSNESIALKASQDVLDRTEGKAVQKNETTQQTVIVKLDHSGVRIGAHYLKPNIRLPEAENPTVAQ